MVNDAAGRVLAMGGASLDAVIAGANKENLSPEDDWFPPADCVYRDRVGRPSGTINVMGVDATGDVAGATGRGEEAACVGMKGRRANPPETALQTVAGFRVFDGSCLYERR